MIPPVPFSMSTSKTEVERLLHLTGFETRAAGVEGTVAEVELATPSEAGFEGVGREEEAGGRGGRG
jgi:hypothetical protein